MYLNKLSLLNFKNYSDLEIDLSPKINCFVGNNGVGKTNLLDAIYYLAFCKSYFNSIDSQNIRHEQPFLVIDGKFSVDDTDESIYCGIKRGVKKVFKRNKKQYTKLSDHIGFLPLVMVSPSDIKLILDGSEERRKLINNIISQYDKQYLENTIKYNRILQHRNALLKQFAKDGSFNQESLEVWDFQLEDLGSKIHTSRRVFIEGFQEVFQKYYTFISEDREVVTLTYKSDLNDNDFGDLLKKNLLKDRTIQYTTSGIHKDDLIFSLEEYPIKKIASQGQQKTYLLALKLAQFDYIKNELKRTPILLLDDVFDKLDKNRVKQIIKLVAENNFQQIFFTDTDKQRLSGIIKEIGVDSKIFDINNNNEITTTE